MHKDKETPQYWNCIIGPTTKKLPVGSDAPLRNAIEKAFTDLTKHDDEVCYSGWGVNEEEKNLMLYIRDNKNRLISEVESIEDKIKANEIELLKLQGRLKGLKDALTIITTF